MRRDLMLAPPMGTLPMRRHPSLISPAIPVYGVTPYLPRFLDSLGTQDHPHRRL